ncbi:glycosyltransferase family 4 protein [Thiolapillus sp.]
MHIREIVMALRELGCDVQMQEAPGLDVLNSGEKQNQTKAGPGDRSVFARLFKYLSLRAPQLLFELAELSYNLWAYFPLSRKLKNGKVDLFYERYAFFSFIGTVLARQLGVPTMLEVNEVVGIERARGQVMLAVARHFERKIFQRADRILVVSSFLKQVLVQRGVSEEKIYVIPNAVRSDRLAKDEGSGKGIRQKLKLDDCTVIGFVGQIVRWDRLDLLIEDIADIPAVHLLVVGPCRFMEELQHTVEQLSMQHAVTFTGAVDREEVSAYIDAMDICVLPHSNPFGSPIVMFEYMAMRKPVLAVGVGPVTDIVVDGINGCIFAEGDRKEFRGKLKRLVEDQELCERIGNAGFEKVLVHHTWDRNAEQLLHIFKGLRDIS